MNVMIPGEDEMLEYQGRVRLNSTPQGKTRSENDPLADGYIREEGCYSRADAQREYRPNGGRSFG